MTQEVKAAKVQDIPVGQGIVAQLGEQSIAIFNVEGKFYAIDNACCHRGGPLGEGELEASVVTCPWHAWRFDVRTGENPDLPKAKVKPYALRVEGEDIWISL